MHLLRDLRFGLRVLMANRTFAAAALSVLALGVGASTAVFSVLHGVLITPLPYRAPDRIGLFRADLPGYSHEPALTAEEYFALRDRSELFESVAVIDVSSADLTSTDIMQPVTAAAASDNFFTTLGVSPLLGRTVARSDLAAGGIRTVDLGYDAWQRYFGGDPAIVGRRIEVNNRPTIVAGVLPRDFRLYLGPGVTVPARIDVWYPRGVGYDDDPFRGQVVIARLRETVSVVTAQAALLVLSTQLVHQHPSSYRTGAVRLSVSTLDREVVRDVKPVLLAIGGAVVFVLLVACANLANLLLARASARRTEFAVRIAIGASPSHVVRQLIAEGLLIGGAGAMVGVLLAGWSTAALLRLAPASLPRREAIHMDGTALVFAVAASMACALAVSLVPAWHTIRPNLTGGLKREASASPAARTGRGVLVAAQLALSLVLLVGAGLMTRAFVNLRAVPLGFDPHHAVAMEIALQGPRFSGKTIEDDRRLWLAFYEALEDAVRALPGVEQAGVGFQAPFGTLGTVAQRYALGPSSPPRQAEGVIALAGYLETLRVRLIAGRYPTRADDKQRALVIDERLAAELWPGEPAVGRRLLMIYNVGDPRWAEVVGVAAHVQDQDLRRDALPQIWMTYGVRSYAQLDLVVRSPNPAATIPAIRQAVQRLGAGRPVHDVRLLDESVAEATADTRFALFALGAFALVGVMLSAIGVYGVIAYATARRTREIAVRLALGADARGIIALVVREGVPWIALGLAGGLAGALVLSRYMGALLFRVGARDPLTFGSVALTLAAVALVATAVPALRAVRISPMVALRDV